MRLLGRGEVPLLLLPLILELSGRRCANVNVRNGRDAASFEVERDDGLIQPLKVTPKATYWPASRT